VTGVLAGDIGGTHARFARVLPGPGPVELVDRAVYAVPGTDSLAALVDRYLDEHPGPADAAAIGIAAPLVGGRAAPINLPWAVSEDELQGAIGHPHAHLLNDLLANAWGISELGPEAVAELQPDRIGLGGNRAVCSAGTGLGIAGLVPAGDGWAPFASEGGHVDFGPRDEREDALLLWLRARHPDWGHVSAERVASGLGLPLIHAFVVETGRAGAGPDLAAALAAGDPGRALAEAALAASDPSAVEALDIFTRAYGAIAGNVALTMLSTGGLYLGGGIAPRILPLLAAGGFLAAFHAKGRYDGLLERMAVRVILDDACALRGAARFALTRLAEDA
jgi:glucokinase